MVGILPTAERPPISCRGSGRAGCFVDSTGLGGPGRPIPWPVAGPARGARAWTRAALEEGRPLIVGPLPRRRDPVRPAGPVEEGRVPGGRDRSLPRSLHGRRGRVCHPGADGAPPVRQWAPAGPSGQASPSDPLDFRVDRVERGAFFFAGRLRTACARVLGGEQGAHRAPDAPTLERSTSAEGPAARPPPPRRPRRDARRAGRTAPRRPSCRVGPGCDPQAG